MPRINEHTFELDNSKYKLTYYRHDKPILYRNGILFSGNKSALLIEYIKQNKLPLNLFKGQTTQQLSDLVLKYFSEGNKIIIVDKISSNQSESSKVAKEKKETPKNKTNSEAISKPIQNITEQEPLNLSNNFKVVMICASKKNDSKFKKYQNINFVATKKSVNEFRPDDINQVENITWRQYLINNQNDQNLLEAYNLYKRNEYRWLYNKYNNDFYILSAGWGLVNSKFKLPNYDITFSSSSKNKNTIRKNKSVYKDFNQFYDVDMIPLISPDDDIIFVGGKYYLELFYQLTQNLPNRKIIYHFGTALPLDIVLPNQTFLYRQYLPENPNNKRNWHYELAEKIANGIIP